MRAGSVYIFFFSSRRRHTRLVSDWSSDVCSSDLEHGAVYSSIGFAKPRVLPGEPELEDAARILNEGKKVAMLVGQGAAGARDELIDTAELLGAGVAKALLGKDVLPDDLPFVTGSIA